MRMLIYNKYKSTTVKSKRKGEEMNYKKRNKAVIACLSAIAIVLYITSIFLKNREYSLLLIRETQQADIDSWGHIINDLQYGFCLMLEMSCLFLFFVE